MPIVFVLLIATIFAVGLLGSTRRIGFWGAFIASVLLTPVGGFFIVLIAGPRKTSPKVLKQKKN